MREAKVNAVPPDMWVIGLLENTFLFSRMPELGTELVFTPLSLTVIVWNDAGKLPTKRRACPERVILPDIDILSLDAASEPRVCLNGSVVLEEEPAHIKVNLVVCEPRISCIQ
jgi:hypothetical protein